MAKTRIQSITRGSLLAASAVVLFLLAQVPLLGPFFCLACPFPLTLLVAQEPPRVATLGCLVALGLVALTQGWLVLLALPFFGLGILQGLGLSKELGATPRLIISSLSLGALSVALLAGFENGGAQALGWLPLRSRALDLVQGLPPLLPEAVQEPVGPLVRLLEGVIYLNSWVPLLSGLSLALLASGLYHLVLRGLLPRFGIPPGNLSEFSSWRAPRVLVLVLAPILVLGATGWVEPESVRGQPAYLLSLWVQLQLLALLVLAVLGVASLEAQAKEKVPGWILRPACLAFAFAPLPVGGKGAMILALLGVLSSGSKGRQAAPDPDPEENEKKG